MDTSVANHVFRIPELLQLIVQELDAPLELARMARVATPSHLPSIRALWSGTSTRFYLGSNTFSYLLQLLPKNLIRKMSAKSKRQSCHSSQPSDWTRLRHYSIHVKAFTIEPSNYSNDLFVYFNAAEPNLFPQLQKIRISDDAAFPSVDWTMLASPTLRDLQLDDSYFFTRIYPDDLASLCRQLSRCTPQLRCLALPTTNMEGSVADDGENDILAAVESLTALTEFGWEWDCQPSRQVIKFMATHPRLTKVCLGRIEQHVGDLDGMDRPFSSLVKLELSGTDVGMESVLMQLSLPEYLMSVSFEYSQLPRRGSEYISLSFISQVTNLTVISLTFNPDNIPWGKIAFQSLSPILNCKKITNFTLTSNPRIEGLDDEAVQAMADSWPALEEIFIYVDSSVEDQGHPLPTPLGLVALANSCPSLRRLTMSVRFTCCGYYDASGDSSSAQDHHSRTLECLDLGYSRWYDDWECKLHVHPEATARILRDIWPALKSGSLRVMLSPDLKEQRYLFERWQRVKQCLAQMEQQQEIARRDSMNAALRVERDTLIEECMRLRYQLEANK